MGRSLFFSITIIFFYISMTCVHIPYAFRKSSLISVNSANRADSKALPLSTEKSTSDSALFTPREVQDENNSDYVVHPAQNEVKVNIYNIPIPEFMRGIYLSNNTANSKGSLIRLLENSKKNQINTFVIDVQNEMVPREYVNMIKNAGIFPVARIAVFLGGLNTKTPSEKYIENILNIMDAAAYQGFLEVQLDYIRYADSTEMEKIPLDFKYETINTILKKTHNKANSLSIFLSADLFGRVTLNENDHIGQKLENFSRYTDTLYPMLYPSHYTNDDFRISHPYETVKEGIQNSVKRCRNTRIVAYIQGFTWKVDRSGKNFSEYLKAQLQAADDAGGNGWVIWNAGNDYEQAFSAISSYDSKKRKKISRVNLGSEDLL